MKAIKIETEASTVLKGDGGKIEDLPVEIVKDPDIGVDVIVSTWKPDPEELEALKNGCNVVLFVYGLNHPPVFVGVRKY